jgi:hypothetical protein
MAKAITIFAVCVSLLVIVVEIIGYSSCNLPKNQGETAQAAQADNCSTPYATFKVGLYESWRVSHDFHEEIITIATIFIAIFTIILGIFTVILAGSTQELVRDAQNTTERQLRAYISIEPKIVAMAEKEERIVKIDCLTVNHGQTPATEINHIVSIDLLPNPLPDDFVYPAATQPINYESALFPHQHMTTWFIFDRLLTTEEFQAVEAGTKRIHLWGTTFYKTAFKRRCHTKFRASVGGADFVANLRAMRRKQEERPSFNWTWEAGHGAGD